MSENNSKSSSYLRLNKFLAQAGYCSRRKADELISQGRVTLNGQTTLQLGSKILPAKDKVFIDNQEIKLPVDEQNCHAYILLNKPVQVVSSVKDPQGRQTILDLLPHELVQKRIYPVGRLDYMSEGLLLLTNNGELTYRLTHPRWHVPKVYEVKVRGKVNQEVLRKMRSGMVLKEGEKLAPVKVSVQNMEDKNTLLRMELKQGVNRQIRRMCRDLNLTILLLKRISQGPLQLDSLPSGSWRHLTASELRKLMQKVGLKQVTCDK